MISRLSSLSALAALTGACGSQDTSACADRIKKRLVAPATFQLLDSSELKRTVLSLADYKRAMTQTADEYRVESDSGATEAERMAADLALTYMRGVNIGQEYVRDVESGSDVSRVNIKFQSESKMGVPLQGGASCFVVRNPSGSDKTFLVMDQ